ncbi:MAG: hypothetical protein PHF86_08630 [Candidatus Nanoarchaeia archaeon]|jgi:hypothetical protein|nr:hypothetical protein [Candidatus Nanoarchaeia archaeon]
MAEIVRNLKKQGAKNREINASIKEVMKMIKENREAKKKADQEARARKNDVEKGIQNDNGQATTGEIST